MSDGDDYPEQNDYNYDYDYDIERYLNIRSAYSPTFGSDGELAFLTNTTGVSQLWRLDEPLSWPRQLTFYDERVTFASYSPERDELVFGMDEGGNERTQFFRLDGDGEQVVPLTQEPDAKHRWGGWSPDGGEFAFASNRRDEAVFDIYVQERDGDEATRVYEGDGWFSVAGWSPDGERLAVTKAQSNFDQDVYVLDIESGEMEHLTPHGDEKIRYKSVNWSPRGDALYLVTDKGEDTL
ncbi:MAG: S9 family peptidase, partial [Halobacteria archaeon]|nr:S9 family peptidase [Halobacteria archaeon]